MNQAEGIEKLEDATINRALEILHGRMKKRGPLMCSPELMYDFIKLKTGNLEHEVFGAILMDTSGCYITHEILFRGTLRETPIPAREVIKFALHHNACMMVVFHNHPSGSTSPSPADIKFTAVLAKILKYVDVQLVDHIIVAGDQYVSFAETGIMPQPEAG